MRQREGVHMTVTTRDRFKVLENLPKIEGVRFKHLEDKKVVVYENGRIFRVLENGYDEPNQHRLVPRGRRNVRDRKSTRLNSSHVSISYAVFCLKKKTTIVIS